MADSTITEKAPVLRLVPRSQTATIAQQQTIQCLNELLRDACRGELIGLAFVALYQERKSIVNTAGECSRSRTFTRGLIADLQDLLRYRGGE